ncbi:hypothetical protein D1P53_006013 [Cryptococcus gattii VGV]|nr:hypothetical protein D1P53_006013 [Cryptococcus gattii VGV]
MEGRLHSLSKGVFVIPFESTALDEEDRTNIHSSTRHTLDQLYETTFHIYEKARTEYEQEKMNEQLSDIADWLERYEATTFLQLPQKTNMLPVAILQNLRADASSSLPDGITSLDATCYTLLGRDSPDVAAALRSIAIGFTGDALGSGRKSSRASIDEVENWWQTNGKEQAVQSLLNAVKSNPANPQIPRRDLFELNPHPDMFSVLNPAPRTSILHSLSNPQNILPFFPGSAHENESSNRHNLTKRKAVSASMDSEKRKKTRELENMKMDEDGQVLELKRLQTLFELWKSAGKTVNLYDWLDNFQGEDERRTEDNKEGSGVQTGCEQTDKDGNVERESRSEEPKRAAQEEDRLHATFIRFVEEARMLGLIRARGKGRRADEVIKSVGLV